MPHKRKQPHPTHEECIDPETKTIDFSKYDQLMLERGYRCYECNGLIFVAGGYGHARCICCQDAMTKPHQWESNKRIRCPQCMGLMDPKPALPPLTDCKLGEFAIDIQCGRCSDVFTIKVQMEYYFVSPPMKVSDEQKDRESMWKEKAPEPSQSETSPETNSTIAE